MGAWVYILKCVDGSYYTGSTRDLDNRIYEHQSGTHQGYTAARRPVELVWSDEFPDMEQAFEVERQIKGWTRKKKEALIRGDFDALHELAECRNETHFKNKNKKA
jgi:predicted GIY-YIG superfamily endonuclease